MTQSMKLTDIMSTFRWLFRNPLSLYFRFVFESARNHSRFQDFGQGYMSRVEGCSIEPHVRVFPGAIVMGGRIGSFSYIAEEATVLGAEIGRFCSIGPGCRIGLGRHPTRRFVSTSPVFFSTARQCGSSFVNEDRFHEFTPVVIGNDVWIGANVSVVDGVRIGHGAIIGAGAVVVSDVPDYSVFAGVPARLIRFRFSASQIAWLTEFQWWDKGEDWIRQNHALFLDMEQFFSKLGPGTQTDPGFQPSEHTEVAGLAK
jgi:virginiamycin A acetyltransferase